MSSKHMNTEKALEKLNGSYKLFRILLVGFLVKHSDSGEELKRLSAEGKYEEARLLAHSIKGLSGNLGANKLKKYALELENTYKNEHINADKTLEAFIKEQHIVVEEIKKLLEALDTSLEEIAVTNEVRIPMEIIGIQHFIEALESFQPDRINKAYHRFKQYEFPKKAEALSQEVMLSMERFDYHAAIEGLTALLKIIKENH